MTENRTVQKSYKCSKHNSTMNIVYSEIPFSANSFYIEASQLVWFANHLIDFYMIWGFNKIFLTEHKSSKMNLVSVTYFSIIYIILVIDEI